MQTFLKPTLVSAAAFFALCALAGTGVSLHAADDASATAELSQPEINAGEMTELQLRITGAEVPDPPRDIRVEGLQIRLTGESTQVQMVNFKVSSSVVYSYVVMPLRTGKFTIPAISVKSTSGVLTTSPLDFSVLDGGGAGAPSSQGPPPQPGMPGFSQPSPPPPTREADTERLAFGEITCPRKSLYTGEMIPVEIRYYFDARYPVQVRGRVDFGSEGIIVERFPDPKESRVERGGIIYNVLTFQTLLSAVKPGPIDIAPAKLDSEIQLPGAVPPGFDDPVFQQMLGRNNPFAESRALTVKTAPLHLEVLPLPREGRPASFAGAVGQFDIDSMVQNPKPAPGDPVVLSVKIGGKGNFNAMGLPVLTDTEGWRTYPPADKFESSDDLSDSGVKTFDFTLIAQQDKKSSPGVEFSYFDPLTEKYQTLTTKPLPLVATSGKVPDAESATDAGMVSPTPSPAQGSSPVAKTQGLPKEGEPISTITLRSWRTTVQRSEFLVATLAMLVATAALAGFLRLINIQKEGGTPASRRRRRAEEIMASLDSETLDAAATYDAALEYAALISGDQEISSPAIAALAARRDALKYGAGRSVALGKEERAKLMEALRTLPSTTPR